MTDLRLAAETVPALSTYERSEERRRILALLREHIESHTAGLLLDPRVAESLGDELVTATMSYDRLAIRHWVELLAASDVADTARLQALLYGLDALIRVQVWKENELRLTLERRPRRLSLVG
jgi:hypothetical protein